MMDWMVEVCTSFKCNRRAYFLATQIFDKFAAQCSQKSFKVLSNKDVHCIGITAMYLSSKYEDIFPLHSKIVSDKIAHKAISAREILRKEEDFLRMFDFKLDFVTHHDFYEVYDDMFLRRLQQTTSGAAMLEFEKLFKMVSTMAMFFIKMSIQNIDFSRYLPSLVTLSAFKAAVDALRSSKQPASPQADDFCDLMDAEIKRVIEAEQAKLQDFQSDLHFQLVLEEYSNNQNRPADEYIEGAQAQLQEPMVQRVASELVEFYKAFDDWHCGLNQLRKFGKAPIDL